ncbi:MAG: hypothetical protein RL660_2358 [Bacteroidota bacterium]
MLLLCSLAIPHVSPKEAWPLGLLSLATPFIALGNVIFIVVWLVLGKWRRMLLSVVAIILCWKIFSVGMAGNVQEESDMRYNTAALKIITYNVKLFNLYGGQDASKLSTRAAIAEYINAQRPDIVCLQEFFDGTVLPNTDNIEYIKTQCKLPYVAFNINISSKRGNFGDIIFSKYPILAQQQLAFADDQVGNHHFQYADIAKNNDTFRVYNLHLQSIKLDSKELDFVDDKDLNALKRFESLKKGMGIVHKLRAGFDSRSGQANQVAAHISKCQLPSIVCGDFNDLPTSYAYFTIRKDMGDAFLDKGFGLGQTYKEVSSVLRIDYVLYDKQHFKTLGIDQQRLSYSDHFPIAVNFAIQ